MTDLKRQNKLVYSIADVTDLTGLGRSFVYEQIKAGSLIMRKAGRRSLIFDEDLRAWLAQLPKYSSDR